jgi:uncharacterized membrane protein
MRASELVRFIAVSCAGLKAGIFLCTFATAPARAALTPSDFVLQQQITHRYFVWMMPALMLATLVSLIAWLVLERTRASRATLILVTLSALGVVFVFVLTRIVNVPINNQLMTWSVTAPPANLRELWQPWEQATTVRMIASITAFAFALLALGRGPAHRRSTFGPRN